MIFVSENFLFFAISLSVVIVGFFLMSGTDGDIYDFRRTTLAPAVVIVGIGLGIYAIFYRKK
jgi:NADH:ubiquinone oxidoreductase subunit K